MLQMREKDSTKLFSSIVCEDVPGILISKRASIVGHFPLAKEDETFVTIPDSNRGSVHIMYRLAFQNCAYVMKIDLGNNYRLTRESMQLHLH